MQRFFSTGDIASIFGVASRTVCKWFDSGELKGFRLPGGKDRRVSEADFRNFCVRLGFSPPARERVLVIGADSLGVESSPIFAGLEFMKTSLFQAGIEFIDCLPRVIVFDDSCEYQSFVSIVDATSRIKARVRPKVVVLAFESGVAWEAACEVLLKPASPATIEQALVRLLR